MEFSIKHRRLIRIFIEIAIKALLLYYVFFIYIETIWGLNNRGALGNTLGFSAIALLFIAALIPVSRKPFWVFLLIGFVPSLLFLFIE